MEKVHVRPWRGQTRNRGRLKSRTELCADLSTFSADIWQPVAGPKLTSDHVPHPDLHAETDEPMEMLFRVWTSRGQETVGPVSQAPRESYGTLGAGNTWACQDLTTDDILNFVRKKAAAMGFWLAVL